MDEQELEDLESDPRFPSGAWTGFYLQYWLPGRHTTDLTLDFREGTLTGTGSDHVGPYTIDGTYDVRTGQCAWNKQYVGRHCVAYRGVNEGQGIWGVWELKQLGGLLTDRDGFHIWPDGCDVAAESDEAERALLTLMRTHFGNRAIRVVYNLAILLTVAVMLIGLALLVHRVLGT
jgi:hypothetical protein